MRLKTVQWASLTGVESIGIVNLMPLFLIYPWELRRALDHIGSQEDVLAVDQNYVEGLSVLVEDGDQAWQAVSGTELSYSDFQYKNTVYRIFEMPGPSLEGDSAISEKISLKKSTGEMGENIVLHYKKLPDQREFIFDAIFNLVYSIRKDILGVDRARPIVRYWSDVLDELSSYMGEDPARQSLIVELADDLPPYMERITKNPKRSLKRIRDMERIQRIREIDKACLIDMARRPGMAIAEKAGPKQRLLAVRRFETSDTLENRVALHCCKLLKKAADRYMTIHSDINIEQSKRKGSVERLRRKAIQWQTCEGFSGVGQSVTPCKSPNYALLQNPHYSRIWNAYTRLVKNEEIRASVWRWQQQLWVNMTSFGFSELFGQWIEDLNCPVKITVAEARVASGLRSFDHGHFMSGDTMPGPYILGDSVAEAGTMHLVDRDGLTSLYSHNDQILLMNADFILIWETPQCRKVVPVYCRMESSSSIEQNIEVEGKAASDHLSDFGSNFFGVILIRPSLKNSKIRYKKYDQSATYFWDISLSVNPTNWNLGNSFVKTSPVKALVKG